MSLRSVVNSVNNSWVFPLIVDVLMPAEPTPSTARDSGGLGNVEGTQRFGMSFLEGFNIRLSDARIGRSVDGIS